VSIRQRSASGLQDLQENLRPSASLVESLFFPHLYCNRSVSLAPRQATSESQSSSQYPARKRLVPGIRSMLVVAPPLFVLGVPGAKGGLSALVGNSLCPTRLAGGTRQVKRVSGATPGFSPSPWLCPEEAPRRTQVTGRCDAIVRFTIASSRRARTRRVLSI